MKRERLKNSEIVIMRTLIERGGQVRPVALSPWQKQLIVPLWRRGLVEVWYRQCVDAGRQGPFYALTIFGSSLAQSFFPAPRGSSGAEQVK